MCNSHAEPPPVLLLMNLGFFTCLLWPLNYFWTVTLSAAAIVSLFSKYLFHYSSMRGWTSLQPYTVVCSAPFPGAPFLPLPCAGPQQLWGTEPSTAFPLSAPQPSDKEGCTPELLTVFIWMGVFSIQYLSGDKKASVKLPPCNYISEGSWWIL